jgi:hypothetical protein
MSAAFLVLIALVLVTVGLIAREARRRMLNRDRRPLARPG